MAKSCQCQRCDRKLEPSLVSATFLTRYAWKQQRVRKRGCQRVFMAFQQLSSILATATSENRTFKRARLPREIHFRHGNFDRRTLLRARVQSQPKTSGVGISLPRSSKPIAFLACKESCRLVKPQPTTLEASRSIVSTVVVVHHSEQCTLVSKHNDEQDVAMRPLPNDDAQRLPTDQRLRLRPSSSLHRITHPKTCTA